MNDWALILGGSSGIGMACAKSLAENGINIYALYLRKKQSQIDEIKKQFSKYNVEVIFKKANASNEDRVWEIHNFYATDAGKVVNLTNKMMESMDDFPGQLGLSQNTYGNGDTSHAFTVGFESIEEMEGWQDKLATDPVFSKWLVDMGEVVEWKGSELVVNAAVYDSALTLEEFVQ